MQSVIYKISSKRSTKLYIGSAVNYNKRRYNHLSDLRTGRHPNRILQNHVNKYGLDVLEFSILEEVSDKDSLIEKEQYYIDLLAPKFNICITAGSQLGFKHSEECKEKMSIIHKNISDETRLKMSISASKRKATDITKKKIGESSKDRKHTEETKQKMRKIRSGKSIGPMSEEHKRKISEANKRRLADPDERLKLSIRAKKRFENKQNQEGTTKTKG